MTVILVQFYQADGTIAITEVFDTADHMQGKVLAHIKAVIVCSHSIQC